MKDVISGVLNGLKRFILWDYQRATWQYDVMVGIILAFLFLTPRAWFRDQPRIPRASQIAALPAADGMNMFWLEAELLAEVDPAAQEATVEKLLAAQSGSAQELVRLEAVKDSEGELKGYMVFSRKP